MCSAVSNQNSRSFCLLLGVLCKEDSCFLVEDLLGYVLVYMLTGCLHAAIKKDVGSSKFDSF